MLGPSFTLCVVAFPFHYCLTILPNSLKSIYSFVRSGTTLTRSWRTTKSDVHQSLREAARMHITPCLCHHQACSFCFSNFMVIVLQARRDEPKDVVGVSKYYDMELNFGLSLAVLLCHMMPITCGLSTALSHDAIHMWFQ